MEDNKNDIRTKRMLLNYILAKMFTNEDLIDKLNEFQENKIDAPISAPSIPQPVQPRFKALMDKMSKQDNNSEGKSEGEEGITNVSTRS